jgi:spermidine synthase
MGAVYRSGLGSRVVMRDGVRELHVDGTFASRYEPGRVITGSVWDARAAGIAALPRRRRRSVLLLGLGGGSAARVVRALAPRAHIVGVEIDPSVVRLARRWFDLDDLDIEVVLDDARAYLERCRKRFDAVLEDVFIGTGRDAVKPEWLPQAGLARAAGRLARCGILASNALDEASAVSAAMGSLFPSVVRIEVEDYDNQIFVGCSRGLTGRGLRRAVAATPVLVPTLPRLSFRSLR